MHYGGRLTGCCLVMVPVNCYGHELEACTYCVPTKVAPASYAHTACQVCVLFFVAIDAQGKNGSSFLCGTAGNNYSAIRGYFLPE